MGLSKEKGSNALRGRLNDRALKKVAELLVGAVRGGQKSAPS